MNFRRAVESRLAFYASMGAIARPETVAAEKELRWVLATLDLEPLVIGCDFGHGPSKTVWRCACGFIGDAAGLMAEHLKTVHGKA